MTMTLRQILDENPDWADLEVVVLASDGNVDFVGDSGLVYADDAYGDGETLLVFSGN